MPRGPAPTPTEVLKLHGSRLPGRRGNEPTPPIEAPECPEWLNVHAREEWDRLVPLLISQRLLTKLDAGALAILCVAWGEMVEAQKTIDEQGRYVTLENGGVQKHPAVAISKESRTQYHQCMQQFGLSPASRTRVNSATPEKKSSGVSSRQREVS